MIMLSCIVSNLFPSKLSVASCQVKPLSIRHIKYGVKAEYVKGFGSVVANVIRVLLGDKCTPEVQAAWAYAWRGVSRCITECLNIGSSLVTIALVRAVARASKKIIFCVKRGRI